MQDFLPHPGVALRGGLPSGDRATLPGRGSAGSGDVDGPTADSGCSQICKLTKPSSFTKRLPFKLKSEEVCERAVRLGPGVGKRGLTNTAVCPRTARHQRRQADVLNVAGRVKNDVSPRDVRASWRYLPGAQEERPSRSRSPRPSQSPCSQFRSAPGQCRCPRASAARSTMELTSHRLVQNNAAQKP